MWHLSHPANGMYVEYTTVDRCLLLGQQSLLQDILAIKLIAFTGVVRLLI